jgi:ribosomal protein L30/L7E
MDIKVTLKKSYIGSTQKVRATLVGVGLTKTNKTSAKPNATSLVANRVRMLCQ